MKTQTQNSDSLSFEKVWAMFQETKSQFQETREQFQESKERQEKTEQMLAARSLETERKIDKLSKLFGGLTNNIGESVEDFFYYGFEKNPKIGNIKFKQVVQRMKSDKEEFDLVLTNGKYVAVIEVKHKFHPNDLEKFINKKIPLFKIEFPKFKDCKIIACIAGFAIPKDTKENADEKGIYIFTQSGESIKSLNSKNFKFQEY